MTSATTRPGRLVVHATLAVAGLWLLLAMLTWGAPAEGPRVSSPWTTFGYGQAALFETSLQILPLLGVLTLHGAAALIGWRFVTAPLWRRVLPGAPHWLAFAGIVPGGMICLVISRVITLGLGHDLAPAAIGLAIAALAALALNDLRRARVAAGIGVSFRMSMLWVCAAAIAVSLVFQVHIDRGHALAEGSIWFIQNLFLSPEYGVGADGRMPIVSQHYDEAAFLYPVVYGLMHPGADASSTLTAVYWVYLAITRAALIVLTWVGVRGFGIDRMSALAVTAFACFASLSLNPFTSRVLFDSLSPMAYVFHAARFLIPILPMLVLSAWLNAGEGRPNARAALVAAALGIALAATPVHAAALAPWVVALAVAVVLTRGGAATLRFRTAAAIAALVVLLAASFAYGLQAAPDVLRAGVLVAAPGLAGIYLLWTAWRVRTKFSAELMAQTRSVVVVAGYAVTGYMFAFMLLGNVLANDMLPRVGGWGDMPIINRLAGTAVKPSLAIEASAWCAAGYEWGYRTLLGHCGSLGMFARTYGLAFVLIASALAVRVTRPNPVAGAVAGEAVINWSLVLCLLALPVSFVLYDFVGPSASEIDWERSLSIWLRSRLIEPWFVSGIVIALAVLLRDASKGQRQWGQIALIGSAAIFALNPLTLPAQFVANAGYLVTRMLGG